MRTDSEIRPNESIMDGGTPAHVAEESTVRIIMSNLLYLTVLTDHDAVVAEMVLRVVWQL